MTAVGITELIKKSFREMMKDVGTSVPGHILAFDPETQLAQIQIGISRKDVNGENFELPPIIECPVYIYGGAYTVEIQLDQFDEGIILFSQRCIDGWVNTGGIANNPIARFHDMTDAMFLPGSKSQPKKIENYANNGVRLRNKDGSFHVWLKNDGDIVLRGKNITFDSDNDVYLTANTFTKVKK